jgi:hypothetical protein
MSQLTFVDGYVGELFDGVGDSDTAFEVDDAAPTALQAGPFYIQFGELEPQPQEGFPVEGPSDDYEVVLVESGQNGEAWTVARGQFGTTAKAHNAKSKFKQYVGAGLFSMAAQVLASGTVTLVAGTVDVANTAITTNSIVRYSRQAAGGTLGNLSIANTAGTKFTINSSSSSDTSKVYYEVVSY